CVTCTCAGTDGLTAAGTTMTAATDTGFYEYGASGSGILRRVLVQSEIESIAEILQPGALERTRAGARHLMRHPAVNQVAHDPRLLSIARLFLDAEPIPFRATLFDKSPRSNWLVAWHQDTALPLRERRDIAGWGPWS